MIRHGQTDFNLKGIVQGSGVDSSLNDLGRRQASAFFDYHKDVPFDIVYTSRLKRSMESVAGFIDKGVPHVSLSGLNEINWGNREGVMITPEEDAYYHSVIRAWQNGETDLRIEGGESPEGVFNRQTAAIEEIISGYHENILVCMHGRAMRILLCQLLNYPLKCMDMFEHTNLCLYKIIFTGSIFRIELFNATDHLVDLLVD